MKRTPLKRGKPPRRMSDKLMAAREAHTDFVRQTIQRANRRCERCDDIYPAKLLHVHHRLPRSQGGKDERDNVACLCFSCHRGVHDHFDDWADWIVVRNTLGKTA